MARPTLYTPDLGVEIAWRSAEGKSLRTICAGRDMPSLRTVFRWRRDHAEFDRLLRAAHEDKADIFFEEALEIADEEVADAVAAARNRLRVEARKWACARLNPNRYGERSTTAHVLPRDPEKPFNTLLPTEQINVACRLAFILQSGLHHKREQDAAAKS